MIVPETVDKLLKDIKKETGLIWYWHATVTEPLPIGVVHIIVCALPIRGGNQYKWFEVQDILLYNDQDFNFVIKHLKEEVEKVRKGENQ